MLHVVEGAPVLHVEVSRMAGDPARLDDAISYLTAEVRPALELQPDSLGTSLLVGLEAGVVEFESFWASGDALEGSTDVIRAGLDEAGRRAGGAFTRERYEVLVFQREADLPGTQGVRMTRMNVNPSQLSAVEDGVAWYGATVVPVLAETGGFRAALLYADWTTGHLVSETAWRDLDALTASRRQATAGEAAAVAAVNGVISGSAEYRTVFNSARPD